MRSGMKLNFLLLGACRGLTLTRDENIAVSYANVATPVFDEAHSYPKSAASGIHVDSSITLAWNTAANGGSFTVTESLEAPSTTDKEITIVCTKCTPNGQDGCTTETGCDETRKFLGWDRNVQVRTFTPSGLGAAAERRAYATITPDTPWLVGTHTVTMTPSTFMVINTAADADVDPLKVPDALGSGYTFTTQHSCKTLKTKIECKPQANTRPDCMWTGSDTAEGFCEPQVVVVSGGTVAGDATGVGKAWSASAAGDNGVQFAGRGVPATAGQVECANGEYTSHGMHDGKPYFSKDARVSVEHGGSSLSWEATAAVNGFRKVDTHAGWVLVCGGGPRYEADDGDVTDDVTADNTWTAVANWASGTVGALKVTQASCKEPLGTEKRAPYGWATTQPDNALARGSFGPAISCAPGYSGSAKATNCPKNGVEYTLSGCTKNSSRRRRRKHSNPWPNNKNQAAPATWNPFRTFWDAIGF